MSTHANALNFDFDFDAKVLFDEENVTKNLNLFKEFEVRSA